MINDQKLRYFTLRFISLIFTIRLKKKFNKDKVKRILLIRCDNIGDMVITTPLIRILHQHGYEVSVISKKESVAFISQNPYIKNTYIWSTDTIKLLKNIWRVRRAHYDMSIDLREIMTIKQFIFNMMTGANYSVICNMSNVTSFDLSVKFHHPDVHIVNKMDEILKQVFEIYEDNLSYDAFVDKQREKSALEFIKRNSQEGDEIIVINPYASEPHRDMSTEQIFHLIRSIKASKKKCSIILTGIAERLSFLQGLGAAIFHSESILDIIPVIKHSGFVITVDTSVLHIASGFNKKIVGLYSVLHIHKENEALKLRFFDSKALPENFNIDDYFHRSEVKFGINTKNRFESIHSIMGTYIYQIEKEKISSAAIRLLN